MSRLIEGRVIAEKVYAELRSEIAQLKQHDRIPMLIFGVEILPHCRCRLG